MHEARQHGKQDADRLTQRRLMHVVTAMVLAVQPQSMHMQKQPSCTHVQVNPIVSDCSTLSGTRCLAGRGFPPAKAVCQDSANSYQLNAMLNEKDRRHGHYLRNATCTLLPIRASMQLYCCRLCRAALLCTSHSVLLHSIRHRSNTNTSHLANSLDSSHGWRCCIKLGRRSSLVHMC
jgi:hypothetical protein